jgi:hypothetical protein
MPDTLEAVTGSRGRHFYFQHPGVAVPNMVGLLPGIDVRGDGGLVVAPPSIHVSGNHYFWDGMDGLASEIAAAPAWLLEMIMGKHSAGEKARFDLPADIPEGQRNETLHRYACSLRGTGGGLEFAIGRLAVYALLEQGIIPGIRLGRRWIVTRHASEQWERTCGMRAGLTAEPEVRVN